MKAGSTPRSRQARRFGHSPRSRAAASKLVAAAILVSIFSASNAVLLTAPRVFYAMARDGLFFRRLAEIHPRFGTPAIAIIATSLWAALLALSGTFDELLSFVVTTGWI